MIVKNLKPKPSVAEYVDRILLVEDNDRISPFSLPLIANGSPTLLFISTKGKIGEKPASSLTLFGQTLLPATLTIQEGFTLIAYFFKPYSLPTLFGIPAPELTDSPLGMHQLAPQKMTELEEQLLEAASSEKRIILLDSFITHLITDAKDLCPRVRFAVNKIQQQSSPDILKTLQKEMYVTEKTFQRMFEKHIGISPNLYRRVAQFHTAFQQLNSRRFSKLSDLAFDNGYSDQSHYIRSFKEFTHVSPTEFIQLGDSR